MLRMECACKGIRTCLICAPSPSAFSNPRLLAFDVPAIQHVGVVCYHCFQITSVNEDVCREAPVCRKCGVSLSPSACTQSDSVFLTLSTTQLIDWFNGLQFSQDHDILRALFDSNSFGVHLWLNALTEAEERAVLQDIDQNPWALSQSGRRKQDYGVSVNFKKRKVKLGHFKGLPKFAFDTLLPKLNVLLSSSQFRNATGCALSAFKPVELCNLEYTPERGSAIDPHIDDSWLWGERLITFNLSGDTFLSLIPPLNEGCTSDGYFLKVPLPRR